jgi:hypothetical protein
VALDLSGLGGLAQATPWGAVGSALTAAASTPASSAATGGHTTSGPKTINVSGFGGRSSGSATQSLTQAEPDRGGSFPLSSTGDGFAGADVPAWFLPVLGGLLVVAIGAAIVRRK